MKLFKEIAIYYREGLLLNFIFQKLKQTNIVLFYLVEEGLFDNNVSKIKPRLEPLEVFQLEPSDFTKISAKADRFYSEKRMLELVSTGYVCLGIKHKEEVVSYMWYNLSRFSSKYLNFKLKEYEACLSGAITDRAYKGKALAPYLRQKVYEHLASMGRTKLYSETVYENIASIKFKRKLNAKNSKLFIWISIMGRFRRSILLRKYK